MKKYVLKFFLIIVLMTAFFGGGVLLAEINIRSQKTVSLYPKKEAFEERAEKLPEQNIEIAKEITESQSSEEKAEKEPEEKKDFNIEDNKIIFGVLGDTQYFSGEAGPFIQAKSFIEKSNPDLVFSTGDLISDCDNENECRQKFNLWKSTMGSLMSKTYATQGNHDRTGKEKSDSAWSASFNFPKNGPAGFQGFTYSFDLKNSHFVVLDSDKPRENMINDTQRSWLEKDLARNKKENTFVFFHEPAYPVSSKIGESLSVNNKDRNALWDILVRHRVAAVFSGHEHIHSRKNINGVYQFVIGNTQSFNHDAPKPGMAEYSYVGSHFAIVTVDGKKINVKIYKTDGAQINSFDFTK